MFDFTLSKKRWKLVISLSVKLTFITVVSMMSLGYCMWYSCVILFLCFLPDYGGSSTMKYTYNPNFSSKSSYMYSGSRTMASTTALSYYFSTYSHISCKYSTDHVMCHLTGCLKKKHKHHHWPSAFATVGHPGLSMCGISQWAVIQSA